MSSVLYYSNYCDKCKNILRIMGKSSEKDDMHFICIDKRFRNNDNGAVYVILENQQKLILPPQIQKVPALMLLKEGNKVIFGNEIVDRIKPKETILTNLHSDLDYKHLLKILSLILSIFFFVSSKI